MTPFYGMCIFSSMHEWFETLAFRVHKFSQYGPYTSWSLSVLTHQTCTGTLMVNTSRQCNTVGAPKRRSCDKIVRIIDVNNELL